MIGFTDIQYSSYFIASLPARWRPYAYLARIDRPIGVWLLLLPGWWTIFLAAGGFGGMNGQNWLAFVLFAVGAVVMRAAGCVVNDLWDRDLDAQVERTRQRPIASGEISPRAAIVFLMALLCVGFVILLQFNFATILLGVLSLPLIVLYPLMKRWTWWPQAFLGLVFNFGALMGWSAVTGTVSWQALALYAGCVFWTLGYDTIYAHQDKEDDGLVGIKSTALKFGTQSKRYVWMFYGLQLAGLCAALWPAVGWPWIGLYLFLPVLHLFWQVESWEMDDPRSSLRIFQSNRNYGLLVLVLIGLI